MQVMHRMSNVGVVPVVVLDSSENAVPVAQALLAGGIDVMEITYRTPAAAQSIQSVAENCPDMLVGAGTIITLDQCKEAIEKGAKFIVTPGFNDQITQWCVEKHIVIIPGCVTPTEIMAAKAYGLKTIKFFPAGVYGGLTAMKDLIAPFGDIKFFPTGGINDSNLAEYISAPFIHAVGGSWICPKADITAGNFEKITQLCRNARKILLGFEVAHIGINCEDAEKADTLCEMFQNAFDFSIKEGNSSNFSSPFIEVMKLDYLGEKGHIAVYTNAINSAIAELKKRGYAVDTNTAKHMGDQLKSVYLKNEFGGFAVHLLQK